MKKIENALLSIIFKLFVKESESMLRQNAKADSPIYSSEEGRVIFLNFLQE